MSSMHFAPYRVICSTAFDFARIDDLLLNDLDSTQAKLNPLLCLVVFQQYFYC
jgi:hypothetical protein